MQDWLPVVVSSVVTVIASSGFWTYILARITKRGAKDRLLLGLAYDKIVQRGMDYIERGWISKDEYEDFCNYLYQPYIDHGGNGIATRIMDGIKALPIRSHSRYSEVTPISRGRQESA